MKQYWKYFIVVLVVVVLDQTSKLLVHYNMTMGPLGEVNVIGDWFRLHYLLNPGMAFGLKLDATYGKLLLTTFRLVAIFAIGNYMVKLTNRKAHRGLILSLALILGGALGNAIDSIFYGVLLDNAPADAPTPWLHGQVIDMLFFKFFEGNFPDWIPEIGGNHFIFFRPVFNLADSFIFIGVCLILIRQKVFFVEPESETAVEETIATEEVALAESTSDVEPKVDTPPTTPEAPKE